MVKSLNLSAKSNDFVGIEMFKDALSGLIYFLATDSSLKIMKNDFYFTLTALFVLKVFKFLLWIFGYV